MSEGSSDQQIKNVRQTGKIRPQELSIDAKTSYIKCIYRHISIAIQKKML